MVDKELATRSAPAPDGSVDLSSRTKRNLEFGKRVYKAVVDMGITQSELARMSGLGRDSVSQYIRGKAVPTPVNLAKLAKALKMEVSELYPHYESNAVQSEALSFAIRAVPGDPDNVWLQMDKKVTADQAMRIMAIANEK